MLFNNIIKYLWDKNQPFFGVLNLVPVLISYSLITSCATSIVFTQQIAFASFPKAKFWEYDALNLIYWKLALREDHNF